MNQETLNKALELQKKIEYYEKRIKSVDDFFKKEVKVRSFNMEYGEGDSLHISNVSLSSSFDETLSEDLDSCGKIVGVYMREIFKLKLNRLKEEYKNL